MAYGLKACSCHPLKVYQGVYEVCNDTNQVET